MATHCAKISATATQKPTVVTNQQFTVIQKKAIFQGKTMDMSDPPEQGTIQYVSQLFIFFWYAIRFAHCLRL